MTRVRDQLLANLQREWQRKPFDATAVLRRLEELLAWLVRPENDTDTNCKSVDLFVCTKLRIPPGLPDDLHDLLFDVGGSLHDTHSSPEVARNFESTPEELLRGTREMLNRRGNP